MSAVISPRPAAVAAATADAIDFARRFMPPVLTPLWHTRAHATLTPAQQLRYNQIHALYFNEQTMFFERALAENVLGDFLAGPLRAELREELENFLTEEQRHSAMFHRLNQLCAPEIYRAREFHFIAVPAAAGRLLAFISRRPRRFPLLLWLMHVQEERALYFGRTFLKSGDDLEPHFVAVQKRHLADEAGHVRCDEILLEEVWPKLSRPARWLNARLLGWMIGEYLSTPRRAGVRVLEALVAEFPELRPRLPELRGQLLGLANDREFRRSLYSPENVPATFRRFDAWPEFRGLRRVMPGYTPGTNTSPAANS